MLSILYISGLENVRGLLKKSCRLASAIGTETAVAGGEINGTKCFGVLFLGFSKANSCRRPHLEKEKPAL